MILKKQAYWNSDQLKNLVKLASTFYVEVLVVVGKRCLHRNATTLDIIMSLDNFFVLSNHLDEFVSAVLIFFYGLCQAMNRKENIKGFFLKPNTYRKLRSKKWNKHSDGGDYWKEVVRFNFQDAWNSLNLTYCKSVV